MAQQQKKSRKWIGYALYGLLLTFALLYYRFPEEDFEDYLQGILYEIDTGLLFSSGGMSLSFPPTIKCIRPRLSHEESPDKIILTADVMYIRPDIGSLLKTDPEYRFMCPAYEGHISGSIHPDKKGPVSSFATSIEFTGIHIQGDSLLPEIIRDNMSGVLNGTIHYSRESGSPLRGEGGATLSLSNGSLVVSPPVLQLRTIDFNKVTMEMDLKDRKINLAKVDIRGKNLLGEVSGSILLEKNLLASRLNLKGAIEPLSDLFQEVPDSARAVRQFKKRLKGGKLHFRVLGTINEPRIQII